MFDKRKQDKFSRKNMNEYVLLFLTYIENQHIDCYMLQKHVYLNLTD